VKATARNNRRFGPCDGRRRLCKCPPMQERSPRFKRSGNRSMRTWPQGFFLAGRGPTMCTPNHESAAAGSRWLDDHPGRRAFRQPCAADTKAVNTSARIEPVGPRALFEEVIRRSASAGKFALSGSGDAIAAHFFRNVLKFLRHNHEPKPRKIGAP